MFSNTLCTVSGIDKNKKTGYLTDEDVKKIESVIKSPSEYHIPEWMMNRRKDADDGVSKHLVTADLTFIQDNDVKMMKKMRSYKGVRHSFGLPVRGQRTRSNFRKNKGKVSLGVRKREGSKAGRV